MLWMPKFLSRCSKLKNWEQIGQVISQNVPGHSDCVMTGACA